MLPSKKIFIGATALLTGVLSQFITAWLLTRQVFDMRAMQGDPFDNAREAERIQEQIESQSSLGFNAITFGTIFILAGTVLLLTGIYQTAKRLEALPMPKGPE